jgi:hypothetical protein
MRLLPFAIFLALTSPLSAQAAPPKQACTDATYRAFDYWAGDWEVTDSAGKTVYGKNRITLEEQGCMLREQWAGSRGGTGQSLNFYDPLLRTWRQVWVGSDGQVLDIRGAPVDGAMRLEGDGPMPGGKVVRHRATWTKMPDGRVRQFWEQSSDAGATWTVAFDGWYRKGS